MTLTFAAWLHTLSPFLVRFTDEFGIRWYGLSYVLGFLAGWAWLRFLARRGLTPLSEQRVGDAMVSLVLGVVVGGRLGYCLFYQPSLLTDFGGGFPFWGVLRLTQGGMSSHGGMLGVALAAWWIARGVRQQSGEVTGRVPLLHVFDLVALAATPGLLFGRLANFVNGELLGKIVAMPGEPAPAWAVKFPQEAFTGHAPPGQAEALAPLVHAYRVGAESDEQTYERMLRLIQSGGQSGRELAAKLEPFIAARHPSQLYQGVCEGLIIAAALWLIWKKPRTPGIIGSSFLALYGVLRIATETIRLPDADLAVQRIAGLSRGQWLSVLMLAGAGALAWASVKWGGEKLGGWGVRPAAPDSPARS